MYASLHFISLRMRTFGHLCSIFKYAQVLDLQAHKTARRTEIYAEIASNQAVPILRGRIGKSRNFLTYNGSGPFANARTFDVGFAYRGTGISTGGRFEDFAGDKNCHCSAAPEDPTSDISSPPPE